MNLREHLKGKLTKKEEKFLIRSFDMIGDIAVIQMPDELVKKEKLIAEAILEMQKNIKVQ